MGWQPIFIKLRDGPASSTLIDREQIIGWWLHAAGLF
jgi:hypothetical protein